MKLFTGLLLVGILLTAKCGYAEQPKPLHSLAFLSEAVVTPHLTWAKPMAGGKIRTLCLVDGGGAGREVIELMERVDLDVSTTFLIAGGKDVDWEIGDGYAMSLTREMMKQNLAQLLQKEYDLLIVSGPLWKFFDAAATERVKTLVRNGAGLVAIAPAGWSDPAVGQMLAIGSPGEYTFSGSPWAKEKDDPIVRGIPFETLPPTGYRRYSECTGTVLAKFGNAQPLIATSTYGKGRVCLLTYFVGSSYLDDRERTSGLTPMVEPPDRYDYAYWEYYFSLLAKAGRWAAGRMPEVTIAEVKVEGDLSKGQGKVGVALAGAPAGGERLAIRVWRKELSILNETAGPFAASTPIKGAVPAGLAFVDVFLQNAKGETLDWHSVAVQVKADAEIAEIQTDKEFYDEGGTVNGAVKLAGHPDAEMELTVSLRDGYRRLIGVTRRKLDADMATADFSLPIPPMDHARMYLSAEVRSAGNVIASETRRLIYRRPYHWDDIVNSTWLTSVWLGQRSYLMRNDMRGVGAARIGAVLGLWCEQESKAWTSAMADENMYLMLKYAPWTLAGHAPDQRAQIVGTVRGLKSVAVRYGALLYVNADELCIEESSSDLILAAFRKWLQKSYGTLEALNQEWETEFKNWDEVQFINLDDLRKRPSRNFAPWSDRHWFMTDSVAEDYQVASEAATEIFPSYRAGTSGAFKADSNTLDFWRLSKVWTGGLAYENSSQMQLMRSFNPDLKYHGFIGYDSPAFYNDFRTWMAMFEGASGLDLFNSRMVLNPDTSLTPSAQDSAKTFGFLARGTGRMLMAARPDPGKVALLYSQASIHLAFINGMAGVHENSREGARYLLTECGLPWHFLSYEQLGQPAWPASGDRVLVLPFSLAMSDEEIQGVRQFVQGGGTVIADLMPGLYDGHCKRRKASAADDIFGVDSSAIKIGVERMDVSGGGELLLPAQKVSTFCKGLKLTTAKACGTVSPSNQPALTVNYFGKGRAVLINGDLFQVYGAARENCMQSAPNLAVTEAVEKLLLDEVARADVQPALKVTEGADNDRAVPLLAKYSMVDGNVRYLGTVRYNDTLYALIDEQHLVPQNKGARFQFQGNSHVYNVLTQQYLGKVGQAQVDLDVVGNSLLAALPYKIDSIAIKADKPAYARGAKVTLTLSVQCEANAKEKHFARVRILSPSGREYEPYTRNVTLPSGTGECLLQLALDEPAGQWTAEAEEVVSGVKSTTAFTVTER